MQNWTEVGSVESVPQKGSRVMTTPDGDVAIFRTSGDEVNACIKKVRYPRGLFTINV